MSEQNNCSIDVKSNKQLYRPVVIVHGLMTGDVSTMQHLADRITKLHPGTKTYVINRFCGLASLEPLWRQVQKLANDLLRICSLHPEGVHVIGYSQGGLITRGMLELYGDKHNVRTFVSLSSPQGGQYGAKCFTKMFPEMTTRNAYKLFYSFLGQHTLSVANFWYDPQHREMYLEYSVYLAVIDNVKLQNFEKQELLTKMMDINDDNFDAISNMDNSGCTIIDEINDKNTKQIKVNVAKLITGFNNSFKKVTECDGKNFSMAEVDDLLKVNFAMVGATEKRNDSKIFEDKDGNENENSSAERRKLGLTRLQRLVLIGGPDDGVISPWQSSQFAILDSTGGLVPLRERQQNDVYSDDDPIGLRQLDLSGRLVEYTVPGIGHHEWHHNKRVLQECIIDWLD